MISLEHNLLFVHIPKTAGTAIRQVLHKGSAMHLVTNHPSIYQFKRLLHPDLYEKLFKFAIVRNPWDRAVSAFVFHTSDKYKKIMPKHWKQVHDLTFTQYIEREALSAYGLLQLPWISLDCRDLGCLGKFFSEPSTRHSNFRIDVDYICRFEKLERSMRRLSKKSGCPVFQVPHVNATQHAHYSEYYDSHTRDLVRSRCEEDIDTFLYTFSSS